MASTLSPSIPQEILDSLSAIKGVFASAKGPRVVQLQQDVNRIEEYLLNHNNTTVTSILPQGIVSIVDQVQEIASKIEGIAQEETLLQIVTDSLQNYLNADRIVVYRFGNSQQGQAIAESRQFNYISLLSQTLPYNSFGLKEFTTERLSFLPNVLEITASQLQFWRNFQVLSGLLMPLTIEKQLWGVIMVHYCQETPNISLNERNLLQQVGMMLTIALQPKLLTFPSSEQHQSIETQNQNTIATEAPPSTDLCNKIGDKVNLGIVDCEEALKKLIVLQKNNEITLRHIANLTQEYQEAEQVITLVKQVQQSLDILSLNTAIQATQENSEEELITIAQQVETIACQARETVISIENWIMELQDTTGILDQSVKPNETDLNTVIENVGEMQKQLQEIVEITI